MSSEVCLWGGQTELRKNALDPYRRLGLGRYASNELLKRMCRQVQKLRHPDINGGDHSQWTPELQEAVDVLSHPDKRAEYDASLLQTAPGNHPQTCGESNEDYVGTRVRESPLPAYIWELRIAGL